MYEQKENLVQDGWRAELELDFQRINGRTRLVRNHHRGPLMVQRPFYPEPDGTCHVYALHPPGGMVQGDCLDITIRTRGNAHALVTSPAAAKCYRTHKDSAKQRTSLHVGPQTCLEWLPQETIVFDRAHAISTTQVHLQQTSKFIGWDLYCLGRPACEEQFVEGKLLTRLEVYRDELPVWIDRSEFIGADVSLSNAYWGLNRFPVMGTFVATVDTKGPELMSAIRETTADNDSDNRFAVTHVDGLIICRFLGTDVTRARELFVRAWESVRPALVDKLIEVPRVWAT